VNNFLDNGTVLPFGLLGENIHAEMEGFKKTYQNTSLRVGVITESYGADSAGNINRAVAEYDVLVFEQNEDQGSTPILYRHCVAASALGSMADFFEMSIRKITEKTSKGPTPTLNGHNGSIVLLLCLNGLSDTGIIVGSLSHPDRKSTIKNSDPRLEAEYNGINIKVEPDGSTSLTFRGATDNYGKPLDASQGDTVISIEKDGSYQTKHKTITQRLAKDGKASLTTDDDISNDTKKNFNVSALENIALIAKKDVKLTSKDLAIKASGSAMLECQKLSIKSESEVMIGASELKIEAESLAKIKATSIVLDGLVSLGGAGGQPILLLSTIMIGTGNIGIPVVSTAISGYATKVTAT
jgi:hypothetical protein